MADRARKIGVENLSARLPVANPRDELGQLAATFNELLGRLEGVADAAAAVHGRRRRTSCARRWRRPARPPASPCSSRIATSGKTARRSAIVEQQTVRLSRIVDDMFTLARADAGNYPVRRRADVPG